jgi:hypothetical protein
VLHGCDKDTPRLRIPFSLCVINLFQLEQFSVGTQLQCRCANFFVCEDNTTIVLMRLSVPLELD